jgi:hypothetical protein
MIKMKLSVVVVRMAFAITLLLSSTIPSNSQSTPATPVLTDKSVTAELAFWNSIKDSKDAKDFKTYLENFPNGMFFDPALQKFEQTGGNKSELSASVGNGVAVEDQTLNPQTSGNVKKTDKKDIRKARKASNVAAVKVTPKKAIAKSKRKKVVVASVKRKSTVAQLKRSGGIVRCGYRQIYRNSKCIALKTPPKKVAAVKKVRPNFEDDNSDKGGGSTGNGGGWGGGN